MQLQFRTFRLQYSTERICGAIGDIPTFRWALYCNIWCKTQRTSSNLRYVTCGPGHIQCNYSSAYSDYNIPLNGSALLMEIWQQFNAGCTTNFAPSTAHSPQFTLCELWSRTFTKYLQLRIFRLQYSAIGICAAIGDIPTMGRALYRKHWAKYCAHPPVFAM
jgi:hypothetical protein